MFFGTVMVAAFLLAGTGFLLGRDLGLWPGLRSIKKYPVDESTRQMLKWIEDEAVSENKSVFNSTWDTNEMIMMSKKIFRPVEMFGTQKYMYRPYLQKRTFRLLTEQGWATFDVLATPESESLLSRTKVLRSKKVSFDSWGFRKTEFSFSTECEETVLFLGDSFTEGMHVNDEETFANRFGRIAHQNGIPVCVVNAGVNGYGSLEEAYIAENYYKTFHYTHVILMYFPNDVQASYDRVLLGIGKNLGEKWQASLGYLKRISEFCRQRNVFFAVAAIPPKEQFGGFRIKRNYQKKLKAFFEKEGILFIDLYDLIQKEGSGKIYFKWDPHFTPYGHEKVAEFLWRETASGFEKNSQAGPQPAEKQTGFMKSAGKP